MSTIRDVARAAGVSTMTVSRYFNKPEKLRTATRAKVEKAIELKQYVPNAAARSLVKGQTKTLSLVLADITNPYFTKISRAVEDAVQELGYTLMLGNTDETVEKERRYLEVLVSQRVDGVILSPSNTSIDPIVYLRQHDIPVVLIDRKMPGAKVDTVVTNSDDAGYQLTKHFIDCGYRDIMFLGGKKGISTLEERLAGYCRALDEVDLTPAYYLGDYNRKSGEDLVEKIIRDNSLPEAIVAANNFVAIGAIEALRRHSVEIPHDIGLACFGDLEVASTIDPFLTVIDHPAYDLGREAARMLIERIEGYSGPPREKELPVELVVRRSSCIRNM
jgi:LacI family transcriptional regulator